MKLNFYVFLGILFFALAHAMVWFQMNGQFLYKWFKENPILVTLIFAIPLNYLFLIGNKYLYQGLGNGEFWSLKLMMSSTGYVIFFILSALIASEMPSNKNIICLALTAIIILIQIFWNE